MRQITVANTDAIHEAALAAAHRYLARNREDYTHHSILMVVLSVVYEHLLEEGEVVSPSADNARQIADAKLIAEWAVEQAQLEADQPPLEEWADEPVGRAVSALEREEIRATSEMTQAMVAVSAAPTTWGCMDGFVALLVARAKRDEVRYSIEAIERCTTADHLLDTLERLRARTPDWSPPSRRTPYTPLETVVLRAQEAASQYVGGVCAALLDTLQIAQKIQHGQEGA